MKCERCNGEGCIERNIPGNEGVPEQDVMIVCPDCDGTGIEPEPDYTDEEWAQLQKDHLDWFEKVNLDEIKIPVETGKL